MFTYHHSKDVKAVQVRMTTTTTNTNTAISTTPPPPLPASTHLINPDPDTKEKSGPFACFTQPIHSLIAFRVPQSIYIYIYIYIYILIAQQQASGSKDKDTLSEPASKRRKSHGTSSAPPVAPPGGIDWIDEALDVNGGNMVNSGEAATAEEVAAKEREEVRRLRWPFVVAGWRYGWG